MTELPAPRGWNTWDVRHHNAVTHLPSGLTLRLAFAAPGQPPADGFTWRHGLAALGPHTIDGRHASAVLEAGGARLAYAFTSSTVDSVAGSAELTGGDPGVRPVLLVDGDLEGWQLDVTETPARVSFTCRPASGPGPARDLDLPEPRTTGWLGDTGAALSRAVTWNTVWSPDLNRVVTPASRDFVSKEREGFYGTIAIHAWDSLLTGMLAGLLHPGYARSLFAQAFGCATPAGFLPNRVSDERGRTDDRSQPPVGAISVLRAYLASGLSDTTRDISLLRDFAGPLDRWNAWWPKARQGPFGLLAFGSDPVDGDGHAGTLDAAKRESGLDDSPMYDEARYDPTTHTMDLADVGLNALHTADLEALTTIHTRLAETGGAAAGDAAVEERASAHRAAAERCAAAHREACARIDEVLWDPAAGLYRNRLADGTFSPHASPTLLYPLLAGVPSPERAAAVADALLRPESLGGSPPLVSTARDDPGYAGTYWRGRVWGPLAWLAAEGLRRYGLHEHLAAIADELLALHQREWRRGNHVRENYSADPAEDVNPLAKRSDALHPWGNLLALIAVQQLVDARADGWRFAHPGRDASIEDLRVAEGLLAVRAGDDLRVMLNGSPLLIADRSTVADGMEFGPDRVAGRVTGPVLVRPPDGGPVTLTIHGRQTTVDRDGAGLVAVPPAAGGAVEFTLTTAHTGKTTE
jgi:mannosylglycerate hydrolase MGH1-like protein